MQGKLNIFEIYSKTLILNHSKIKNEIHRDKLTHLNDSHCDDLFNWMHSHGKRTDSIYIQPLRLTDNGQKERLSHHGL